MEGEPNLEQAKIEELKALLKSAHDEDLLGVNDKIIEKVQDLRKKYPDYQNYSLYHLLVGSSEFKPSTEFDFPREDSIEDFIRNL